MKKITLLLSIVIFTLISFSACKSSKKGCGLTSDAQKIEQNTSQENTIAKAK
ncbi:hypothetical protein [Lutibacter sp. B1]|uniref:hypothetical protein n=1 Tax=Lutibacter sp. B1 TaxID=2725996 RepID=UPI001457017D|nr:hypothetical protein [Lutibacter sp. B1]NLP56949.1 hypothetical protein [Lutibacter sp. B1]